MNFEKGHIYHIYNQGNNRQNIFFGDENYRFFLKKIETYILPYADILAWCLMPNHFHLMVFVNEIEVDERLVLQSGRDSKSRPDSTEKDRKISFNQSIGIMLASYTRAINKQQVWSGSLFRKETKAICLTLPNGVSPAWFMISGVTCSNNIGPEKQYPDICFNYILFNPVKAGFVKKPEDWEYSSCCGTLRLRNDNLINSNRIREYGLEVSSNKSGYDFE